MRALPDVLRGWLAWLAVAVVYGVLVASAAGDAYSAPLLVVLAAGAAALAGPTIGATATLALLAAQALGGEGRWPLVYLAAVATASVASTALVRARLSQARARSAASVRLLSALVASLRAVTMGPGDQDVNATLPGLLGRDGDTDLRVWRTTLGAPEVVAGVGGDEDDDGLAAAAVLRVLEGKTPVFEVHATRRGPRYLVGLPVLERGDVASVITALRGVPFAAAERAAAADFAEAVGNVLATMHERREGELVLEYIGAVGDRLDARHAARMAVDVLAREIGVTCACLLRYDGGVFRSFTRTGTVPDAMARRLDEGVPFAQGVVWEVYADGQSRFLEDYAAYPRASALLEGFGIRSLAMMPVSGGPRSHYLLALYRTEPMPWRQRERALLTSFATVLRGFVAQAEADSRLATMLRLERELLAQPVDAMYSRLLASAVELVAGAEAGSLLVRGADGRFGYAALAGYDAPRFEGLRYDDAAMQTWYGDDRAAWARGEPRILRSNAERTVGDVSALTAPRDLLRGAGRIDEIVANLCLPVRFQGKVLAVLNLDALHDPDAFVGDATEAAIAYVPLIGFLLHEASVRQRLDDAARTDALTGLHNRRAFDERVGDELVRSARYGMPMALLVMDLTGFKAINDRYGHAVGDAALCRVAQALRSAARASDGVYRWGGDEFAAILARADPHAAHAAAERFAAAVADVSVEGVRLGVNIGAASSPTDGSDLDTLLRVADERMYAAKATGVPVVEPKA